MLQSDVRQKSDRDSSDQRSYRNLHDASYGEAPGVAVAVQENSGVHSHGHVRSRGSEVHEWCGGIAVRTLRLTKYTATRNASSPGKHGARLPNQKHPAHPQSHHETHQFIRAHDASCSSVLLASDGDESTASDVYQPVTVHTVTSQMRAVITSIAKNALVLMVLGVSCSGNGESQGYEV